MGADPAVSCFQRTLAPHTADSPGKATPQGEAPLRLWEFGHRRLVELAQWCGGAHRLRRMGADPLPATPSHPYCLYWPSPGLLVKRGRQPQAELLGTPLRPLRPASQLLRRRASSPSPAWAMHYPRKIEDLMEAISTRGSHSIQAQKGGQNSVSWLLCPP